MRSTTVITAIAAAALWAIVGVRVWRARRRKARREEGVTPGWLNNHRAKRWQ